MAKTTDTIEIVLKAKDNLSAHMKRVTGNVKKSLQGMNNSFTKIAGAFGAYVGIRGIAGVMKGTIRAAQSMEDLRQVINAVSDDMADAQDLWDWVIDFEVTTPFKLDELIEGASMLKAYGLEAKKLLPVAGDLAAVMNRDLIEAVNAFGMAAGGSIIGFRKFGITLASIEAEMGHKIRRDMEGIQELMDTLMVMINERAEGGMLGLARTFSGKLSTIESRVYKTQAVFGRVFTEAFLEAAPEIEQAFDRVVAKLEEMEDAGEFDELKAGITELLETYLPNLIKKIPDLGEIMVQHLKDLPQKVEDLFETAEFAAKIGAIGTLAGKSFGRSFILGVLGANIVERILEPSFEAQMERESEGGKAFLQKYRDTTVGGTFIPTLESLKLLLGTGGPLITGAMAQSAWGDMSKSMEEAFGSTSFTDALERAWTAADTGPAGTESDPVVTKAAGSSNPLLTSMKLVEQSLSGKGVGISAWPTSGAGGLGIPGEPTWQQQAESRARLWGITAELSELGREAFDGLQDIFNEINEGVDETRQATIDKFSTLGSMVGSTLANAIAEGKKFSDVFPALLMKAFAYALSQLKPESGSGAFLLGLFGSFLSGMPLFGSGGDVWTKARRGLTLRGGVPGVDSIPVMAMANEGFVDGDTMSMLRSALESGGLGGREVHVHLHTLDGVSTQEWLEQRGGAAAIVDAIRRGAYQNA